MAKYQEIYDLYQQTIHEIANPRGWLDFLTSACYNYKCPFDKQVLIYAQRPEAIAVLELEKWNKLFGRWINKGTTGIAVFAGQDTQKLKYYFDVSDTSETPKSTVVPLWQMSADCNEAVIQSLIDAFHVEWTPSIASAVVDVSDAIVDNHLNDVLFDVNETQEIGTDFTTLVKNSIAYMMFIRMGIESAYINEEIFHGIEKMDEPAINSLGLVVSELAEVGLREISKAVIKERGYTHETIRLHHSERREDSEYSDATGGERGTTSIRTTPTILSEGPSETITPTVANDGEIESAFDGDTSTSGRNAGEPRNSDDERTGSDRTTQTSGSNEMGGIDEQHHPVSEGNRATGHHLQIDEKDFPTAEEQQNIIEETEVIATSVFSISQEEIDAILTRGSNMAQGKYRIYEQYLKDEKSTENINFLKDEYGWGGSYPALDTDIYSKINESHDQKGIQISKGSITKPDAEITLSWNKVDQRIRELVNTGSYLNEKELAYFPKYQQNQAELKERWTVAKEFNSLIRDYNDYMRELGETDKLLNQYVLIECSTSFARKMKKTSVISSSGTYILPLMQNAMETIIADNTPQTDRAIAMKDILNGDMASSIQPEPEPDYEYQYHLGDVVYIGAKTYDILSFDNDEVRLYDENFPLLNKVMPRVEFDASIQENSSNDHLKVIVSEPEYSEPLLEKENEEVYEESLEEEQESVISLPKFETAVARPAVQSFDLHPEVKQADRLQYRITNDDLGVGAPKEKFRANITAIKLLKQLTNENRFATPAEQEVLSGYVGFGSLPDAFDVNKTSWSSEYQELKDLLAEDEYTAARESTLTAFYTAPAVIRSMYQAIENMGFKSGNILEPSCGTGNFIGMLPESMQDSKIYGVELDSITGRIAQHLYQQSNIAVQGFEKTTVPDSFFDVAIGNVPFGQFKVNDKKYNKNNWLIHDYFFGKTLDKVRTGGIVAFITSKGTLDKESPAVRKYLAQRADLVGAIRLPNTAFKANAGTEVTSDIIFLQKRDRIIDIEPSWVHLGKDDNGLTMNQYFTNNPQMIIGEMQEVSGPYGPETACIAPAGQNLEQELQRAIGHLKAKVTEYETADLDNTQEDLSIPADPNVRNFSYTVVDGELYYRENSRMHKVSAPEATVNRIKGMVAIRDCVRTLIDYQLEEYPDTMITAEQSTLNELYDNFTKKYGLLSSRGNRSAMSQDNSSALLLSLEHVDEDGNLERKADMFHKRTIKAHTAVTSVDTASEALAVSLADKAAVDMQYMCQLTSKDESQIANELSGVIFKVPDVTTPAGYEYQPADEYLSGNVRTKLRVAQALAEKNAEYKVNVAYLERVQPQDLGVGEVSVKLGATWVKTQYIRDFILELLNPPFYVKNNIQVHYSNVTGEWNVEGKSANQGNVLAEQTYGTSRINAYKIIESSLNLRAVRVFDYVYEDGKQKAVLNKKETEIAAAKQELIKEKFAEWIWTDVERRTDLLRFYNEQFNSTRPREYDGSHIKFSGMNPEISLRKHQVDAIARTMYGGNTLLAHVVGAGKTYEMVASAMEQKRLGLCHKSLFVVPNHLTEQWGAEFLQLYPAANILVATKKDFETKNRKKFCARIATGDYDAVIIGHSQFEKIPMSPERQYQILDKELRMLIDSIAEAKFQNGENWSIKQMEKSKKNLESRIEKLNDQTRKDDLVNFEELGVDRIFVDEAHQFKNLFLFTKMRNVGGIAQTEAQKSSDLYMKCRYMDELTGGKGIIFATGTPVSNSMTELYTMQRYLQYHTLEDNNLQYFDSWASTFGETVTANELAPEGTGYRTKTRFSKFYNLPELLNTFKEVADIQTADMLNLPVPKANYHNVVVKPSEFQKRMVADLADRAEKVRNNMVDATEDNMLKITNDGRKLALDQRMMNEELPDFEGSKINACVNNVYHIWHDNMDTKATQLVFCDSSTPKEDGTFSVYTDIKQKLIAAGVPEKEIAFIHEAKTEKQKADLFTKVRKGDVRVLLGSTAKMGAGTNVQNKLIASHDIDCPWRPSDLEQRLGRTVRQGNTNPEVDIFRYVTEETFDAYLYQIIENKQKFIAQIMTSKTPLRAMEDVDEAALSYAEIKALATGNPLIKERMDLETDLTRLKLLRQNHMNEGYRLEHKVTYEYPKEIKSYEARIHGYTADLKMLEATQDDDFSMVIKGETFDDRQAAGEKIIELCNGMSSPDEIPIGEYRGLKLSVLYDMMNREYVLTMQAEGYYRTSLSNSAHGNMIRLENTLIKINEYLDNAEERLKETLHQKQLAEETSKLPFAREDEYQEKQQRLEELDKLLVLDETKAACVAPNQTEEYEDDFER